MTPSQHSRSTDVREAVGHQIRRYRLDRQHAAADQRQHLAAQAAQLHDTVTDALATMDADLATSAESQREQLRAAVAAVRDNVANLLQQIAAERRDHAVAARGRRSQELHDLRQQVAAYLSDLSAQRTERAAQWPRLRLQRPVAPSPPRGDDRVQRIGQTGMVAYVQMARVSILRAIEDGASGEAKDRQIATHAEGLIGSVRPFLAETMGTLERLTNADRKQIAEVVAGVYRNVDALIHELEVAPWPTVPSHRHAFLRLIEDLRHRLAPLRDEIDATAQALQGDARPRRSRAHPAEPDAEAPPARSFRDNLTTIHGIGPALQQRLDRAGICTYIQLALSSPEDLRKALGEAGRLANVEDWIVQARSLAGMPD